MKKIISVLLASLMVLATLTVSAAAAVTVNPADVDLSTQTVTITGTGTANASFILLVTNPGYDKDDVEDKAVQNIREVKIGENGEFTYKFTLFEAKKGTYTVYADGIEKDSFYYGAEDTETDAKAIIDAAKADDTATIKTKLTTEVVLKNLSIDKFEPLVSTEIALDMDAYILKLVSAIKAEDTLGSFAGTDAENAVKLQSIIKKVAALELLNQGKEAAYSFNTDGTFKYDSALKVSGIDAKYSISVYEYYTEGSDKSGKKYTLSPEGKTQVKNALLNKNFADEEDLYDAFIEAVVCAGVNNGAQVGATSYTGHAHINALLTSANITKAGVTGTITDYIASNLSGYGSEIATVEGLNGLIAGFAQAEKENNSGSGLTGGGGGGGGGVGGVAANGTAVLPPVVENQGALNQNDQNQTNTYKYKFDDIADVQWAVEAIEYLYVKGVVNGKADRVFDPNGTVTREEIVKMISIAIGLTEEADIVFNDVDSASWAKPFIAKAVKAGIISGIGENMFGFGQSVTRQDIATMLYRVIGVQETVTNSEFADNANIADYAKEAVSVLSEKKIINGFEDNTFRPEDSCTRAQAAVIIYNYLKTSGLAN